jgi:hypothetical protein
MLTFLFTFDMVNKNKQGVQWLWFTLYSLFEVKAEIFMVGTWDHNLRKLGKVVLRQTAVWPFWLQLALKDNLEKSRLFHIP